MIIGERLKKARISKGLSQAELGKLVGVSKVSICGYENGMRTPSFAVLVKIINALDVDLEYLLGYDVPVITEENEKYRIMLAKEDLEIINEIKKHPALYNKLVKSPKRMVEIINRQMTN